MQDSLKDTSIETLQQLIDLLLQLDPETYQEALSILSGSSIGKHVRHISEFYLCLFKGLGKEEIDYDARPRNLLLENNSLFAVQTLREIVINVNQIKTDQVLKLKTVYKSGEVILVQTSLYRELIYNLEHCIHHLASIRIGISAVERKYNIPATFGVAPSTIRNNESSCAQ